MQEKRPIIRQLNQTLINQIAAGEVIERPAAALKELVENAIDAGAKSIEVKLRDGGKSLIQVTDDGCGMTAADLALAMQRHATSKLPEFDLFCITTLGFRGEALPSIGSVSRLNIISHARHLTDSSAVELFVEGGEMHAIVPVSYPKYGTQITIKDLFYATPARLKFLKSEAVENAACIEIIKRLALSSPHIAFACYADDRLVLDYKAVDSLAIRCCDVFSSKTYDNLKPIEASRDGIHVHGMISLPTFHKSQAHEQFFFVNNRPVRDRLFMGVLKAAYHDFIEKGRHPVVALFVGLDPREVDVNVHPTKAEVRFRAEQQLRSLLIGSIRSTLTTHGQEAALALTQNTLMKFQPVHRLSSNDIPAADCVLHTTSNQLKSSLMDRAHNHQQSQSKMFTFPTNINRKTDYPSMKPIVSTATSIVAKTNSVMKPAMMDEENLEIDTVGRLSSEDVDYSEIGFLGIAKAQIGNSFIITETEDGMMLIDQHAAHERVRYEMLKGKYLQGKVAKQFLMVPQIISIQSYQKELLTSFLPKMKDIGFDVDVFDCEIVFRSVPALLISDNLDKMLHDILSDILNDDSTLRAEERLFDFLATHACHTSIKAGDKLSLDEMNHLLRLIENTPNSAMCNHGRPTYIKLQIEDLKKLFHRT